MWLKIVCYANSLTVSDGQTKDSKMKTKNLLIAGAITVSSVKGQNLNCNPTTCRLPNCKCPTRDPPVPDPPQFLLLTFDDAMQPNTYAAAMRFLENRRNPNGCPALTTYYTQVAESDPYLVTQFHARGHEIADHSVNHNPPAANSADEIVGMRSWAHSLAGINIGKIRGMRFPFLNYSAEALAVLSRNGFLYDSSMANFYNENYWPYTMDYGIASDCLGVLSLCNQPNVRARGVWQIPMNKIRGKTFS